MLLTVNKLCLKETIKIKAVSQYAFLSVLVFLWTCKPSSVAAQVLSQYTSLHLGKNG